MSHDRHEHLAHELAHQKHYLSNQGPIGTFIHHNTLHGLQHLPFEQAIDESRTVVGGHGYLSNEEFRSAYAGGRIDDDDIADALAVAGTGSGEPLASVRGRAITADEVRRVQLVHGVADLPPGRLRFERDLGSLSRLRPDLPPRVRTAFLQRASQDLARDLSDVGPATTLAGLLEGQTGLPLRDRLRIVARTEDAASAGPAAAQRLDAAWHHLGVPATRRDDYLDSVDRETSAMSRPDRDRIRARWLEAEVELVDTIARRHFGVQGTYGAIADQFGENIEGTAVAALWAACLQRSGAADPLSVTDPQHLGPRVIEDGGGATDQDSTDPDATERDTPDPAAAEQADELARLGTGSTNLELIEALTGEPLRDLVNGTLIRLAGSFLDEGLGAWRMPDRWSGFYAAWRASAADDIGPRLAGVRGWRAEISGLPWSPSDAIIAELDLLGVPEADWGAYLGRELQALPGWAALISWREARPAYPRQAAQPIDIAGFLAVRLFYERCLVATRCRDTWGIDPSIRAIRAYFAEHQAEHRLRRALQRGGLPDGLADDARRLAGRRGMPDSEWRRLAMALPPEVDGGPRVRNTAWRLFHLAQLLGLTASDVRGLGDDEPARLLGALDAFPPEAHGPIWLRAYERHYREEILGAIAANRARGRWLARDRRPSAQVFFCIDEREEAIRRHLEEIDPEIETFGAAGFYGIPMQYAGLDDHELTPLCPPVITPTQVVTEVTRPADAARRERVKTRATWWGVVHDAYWEMKRNFLPAYFLIDLLGLLQAVPLAGRVLAPIGYQRLVQALSRRLLPPVRTELTVTLPEAAESAGGDAEAGPADGAPLPDEDNGSHGAHGPLGFATTEQADRVEAILRNVGLTHHIARLVLFAGHGSLSLNNPHESAHDCGAAGGKHGGPNARAFTAMANRPPVRKILAERGIDIPPDTHFVGAQHNTCSELVTFYDIQDIPASHRADWDRLVADIDQARARSAQERCRRFGSAPKDASPARSLRHIEGRAIDLSQVRPEWGHATNAMAVVGRRAITQGLFLDRRPFLISYDPTQDPTGAIVERILLSVGPVGAGINLEYYFSTVDNKRYGADTKVPHNVSGLVGVMEGAMSDLRTGLPRQMVEVHEPMRLHLLVEASTAILGAIYGRQAGIRELLDNAWVHVVAVDPESGDFDLFVPGTGFVRWRGSPSTLPVVSSSFEWYRGKTGFVPPALIEQPTEQEAVA